MSSPALTWLLPGDPFPDVRSAWSSASEAPGLLAAGGSLATASLLEAYSQGIFPWFSTGQPVLWWSPDPRMVLVPENFRLHRSLRKKLRSLLKSGSLEVRFDHDFASVVHACADSRRAGQSGTWIVPDMQRAYRRLHEAGFAHSVETWIDGELAGGLYCVSIGKAVFGESMFSRQSDASKIALSALVGFCLHHDVPQIDCQQNTSHLSTLGGAELQRAEFVHTVTRAQRMAPPRWEFDPVYWDRVMMLTPPL